MNTSPFHSIGVVGCGVMGRGIVQIFAQCGIAVRLYDAQPRAVDSARASIGEVIGRLVEKGRMSADAAEATLSRIMPVTDLSGLAGCDLIIEAIIERIEPKRELFAKLEAIVAPETVLASNTSSLPITAIAAGCSQPGRVAGYHFFNPVPLMKIVEVIGGARTEPDVLDRLQALARAAGHHPVIAADTPGFIVNHAGRAFGTEALKIIGEGVTDTQTVDRIMREQVSFGGSGFRLGPFELMDLTGLDVSHPAMESIYRQFYEEPRFRPSMIAAQRMSAGLVGRKAGEGWYRHVDGKQLTQPEPTLPAAGPIPPVWVAPGPAHEAVSALVAALGARVETGAKPGGETLIVLTPLGLDATTACADWPAERAIALDTLFPFGAGVCQRRTLMSTPATRSDYRDAARMIFAADGVRVGLIHDSAGFVAPRIVAMIVAIASEIAQQRIATPADIDAAVRLGLGYPIGPLEMGNQLGPARVARLLEEMFAVTGDPRYRPSLWLRRRAQLGLSLHHPE
jgi:3-hydroxybutyryl-CoA dehydrogenase